MAGTTLSGLLQCQFFPLDSNLQTQLQTGTVNLEILRPVLSVRLCVCADLVQCHAGVFGLSSCILSSPYDMTVTKTLCKFRCSHHDNWQEHQLLFQIFNLVCLLCLTKLLNTPKGGHFTLEI
uniref:Uncharacterized protein n=1 Tax=Monopterus albus TaxID=43700 RepID=A0A3Q3IM86_MONAL